MELVWILYSLQLLHILNPAVNSVSTQADHITFWVSDKEKNPTLLEVSPLTEKKEKQTIQSFKTERAVADDIPKTDQ